MGRGFFQFLKVLKTHCEDLSAVTVGMVCVLIDPLLISNFARLSLRKTKTDKKESRPNSYLESEQRMVNYPIIARAAFCSSL